VKQSLAQQNKKQSQQKDWKNEQMFCLNETNRRPTNKTTEPEKKIVVAELGTL
jgi:hypothetical protein